jgi:hypothetical protein
MVGPGHLESLDIVPVDLFQRREVSAGFVAEINRPVVIGCTKRGNGPEQSRREQEISL